VKKLIKNSQPFGKKIQKTIEGIFFDSHCTSSSDISLITHQEFFFTFCFKLVIFVRGLHSLVAVQFFETSTNIAKSLQFDSARL